MRFALYQTRIWFGLMAFLTLLNLSCQKQTSGWKGSIERRGGVTIVKNPKTPLYGPEIFGIKKDLTIGKAEGEKEYIFSDITGIDVDGDGNIYIIDRAEAQVRVFDKTGRFLRTIGRKGQGPGETQMPGFVQITSKNEVFVYDYTGRAVFYSLAGSFLRQIPTGLILQPLKLDSQGYLTGIAESSPPPLGGKKLKRYDPAFNLLGTLATEEQGQPRVFDIGRPVLYCCAAPDDHIVWGNSGKYLLNVLNERGELVKTIERDYDPVPITSNDRETFRKKYEEPLKAGLKISFRDHFPAFGAISADDAGRIFVKTYERAEGPGYLYYYDVFDSDGRYIAKVLSRVELNRDCVWKNHKLYAIESEEQGFPVVNRYDVSWKK